MYKRMSKRIISCVLICLVTVTAFETISRILLPLKVKRYVYAHLKDVFNWHREHVRFSPKMGFVMAPLVRYRLKNREYSIDISTNSQGFRDDEQSMNGPDVVILGDSFVFGSGVSDGETFSDHLERMLGLRVLNAGVACYGTLQELRMMQDLLARDIAPQQHTFVFFYSGNDLRDNLENANLRYRPYLVRDGNAHSIVEPIHNDFTKWANGFSSRRYPRICRYSYFAFILAQARKTLRQNKTNRPELDDRCPMQAIEHVASAFAELPISPKPVFVYIPTINYYESDSKRNEGDTEFAQLSSTFSSVGLSLLDLRPVLKRSDYYQYDAHWQESGHNKVAQFLASYLQRELPPTRPESHP